MTPATSSPVSLHDLSNASVTYNILKQKGRRYYCDSNGILERSINEITSLYI